MIKTRSAAKISIVLIFLCKTWTIAKKKSIEAANIKLM
jgi:hypothetical protein